MKRVEHLPGYTVIIIVLLCMISGDATAGLILTNSINYQGKLTDNNGNPLNGQYTIRFRFYENSWDPLWYAYVDRTVQCENGLFTTDFPLPEDNHGEPVLGESIWLGILVNGEDEMTPRQEIKPVPYALSLRQGARIPVTGGATGIQIVADNLNNRGIEVYTDGGNSPAIYVQTQEPNSQGFAANTYGNSGSHGIDVFTRGSGSYGIKAQASGQQAHAVWGQATGTEANGIVAYSTQWTAIYADTSREDQKYGLYTPDYIYAGGTEVPSSDVAEYIPVTDDVEPGTVMIIGETAVLQVSTIAYDTRVAGIVSTHPGVSLGTKDTGNPGEEQIAIAGRVPCKVDARYGAIHPGDVLTTSPNPGYAMKAEPVDIGGIKIFTPSTVLGKAMGTLESGTGEIEVLVTLQ